MLLEPEDKEVLVNMLKNLPSMNTPESRKNMLYMSGLDPFIHPNLDGSAKDVAISIVREAENYGIMPNEKKHTLEFLIEYTVKEIGMERRKALKDILFKVKNIHKSKYLLHEKENTFNFVCDTMEIIQEPQKDDHKNITNVGNCDDPKDFNLYKIKEMNTCLDNQNLIESEKEERIKYIMSSHQDKNQHEIQNRRVLLSRLLGLPHLKVIKIGIQLNLARKEDINTPEQDFLKQFYKKLDETNNFSKLWEIMQQHKPDPINTTNPFQ